VPVPYNRGMPPPPAPLLAWYDRNRRRMPWRALPGETPDPYGVWLSEIMLQQTTVTAVVPYFERFLTRFPTVEALAAAEQNAVMAAWAGLGYYARARNLHACAQAVAAVGGRFPHDITVLRALPGIGAYTANAIAAIAFNQPVIPVDGNVERIAARLFAIETPLPGAKPALAAAAATLHHTEESHRRAADFAQALFDLGATICTPRPVCGLCPWSAHCRAHRAGIQDALPARTPKTARPVRHGAHFWLQDAAGEILLRRRPDSGLLGGMTELPGTDWRHTPIPVQEAHSLAPMQAAWASAGKVRHVFTHFELRLDVYAASVPVISVPTGAFLRPATALDAEALPSLMRKCVKLVRPASREPASREPASRETA
jgi:A/G-specific adenine glycosylase